MWVMLPVYDGVSSYPDTLVNLDAWKFMESADGGDRSKLKDGVNELLIDIEFESLANQIKVFSGGIDITGNKI